MSLVPVAAVRSTKTAVAEMHKLGMTKLPNENHIDLAK